MPKNWTSTYSLVVESQLAMTFMENQRPLMTDVLS